MDNNNYISSRNNIQLLLSSISNMLSGFLPSYYSYIPMPGIIEVDTISVKVIESTNLVYISDENVINIISIYLSYDNNLNLPNHDY